MTDTIAANVTKLKDQAARQLILRSWTATCSWRRLRGQARHPAWSNVWSNSCEHGTCRNIRTMAAVTFTRKAAAELKSRFRIKLEECVRSETGPARDNS